MRIGVISDTHDRIPAARELLTRIVAGGCSMVLHAGDYCSPFLLDVFADAHVSLAGVFGRNDGDTQGLRSRAQASFGAELFESPHSFDIAGERILIVHDIADVQQRSIEGHSIVIHGHTHQHEMKHRGDTLILNPGEACGWLTGTPTAAILDLETKHVEFLSLDPAEWRR